MLYFLARGLLTRFDGFLILPAFLSGDSGTTGALVLICSIIGGATGTTGTIGTGTTGWTAGILSAGMRIVINKAGASGGIPAN